MYVLPSMKHYYNFSPADKKLDLLRGAQEVPKPISSLT
jgi:hypothetical protein